MNGIFNANSVPKAAIFLVIVSIIIMIGVCYFPEMRKNKGMREKIIQLDEQIKKEELTEKELRGYIDALRNDPKTIERLLRENGFARPGETVFRFEKPPIQ